MMYKINLSSQAVKFLRQQDEHISSRLKDALRKLVENPFQYLEHYEGSDYYKFRIGDYRALVDVDNQENTVWIRVLDKRGRIYK